MKRFSSFIVTVALLEGVLTPSQAQFCWNPKPLPACRTFLITEIGFNRRVSSSPVFKTLLFRDGSIENQWGDGVEQGSYVTSDLGFMRNINPHYALGASNFFGFIVKSGEYRGGLKLRVRRWLTQNICLDVSPGVLLLDSKDTFQAIGFTKGFTSSVDLKFKEWFALSLVFEYRRYPDRVHSWFDDYEKSNYSEVTKSAHDIGIYIGVKTGSYAGLIGHGVFGPILGSIHWASRGN